MALITQKEKRPSVFRQEGIFYLLLLEREPALRCFAWLKPQISSETSREVVIVCIGPQ
jgi:hypothetical protein